MMSQKVKDKGELPKWFDRRKYDDAKSLDAKGWLQQLLLRKCFYDLLAERERNSPAINSIEGLYEYKLLEQSRKDPIHFSPAIEDYNPAYSWIDEGKDELLQAISPITLRRLYRLERWLPDEVRRRMRAYIDKRYSGTYTSADHDEEHEWAEGLLDRSLLGLTKMEGYRAGNGLRQYDVVNIDLSLPDAVLIEQFESYLTGKRAFHRDKKPSFDKLIEFGVLSYLDLDIWSRESERTIPHRVMADAIFPASSKLNELKDEDTVRKTVMKTAHDVLTPGFLHYLTTLSAGEEC